MREKRRKTPDVPRTAWTPAELATSMGIGYQTVLDWIHEGRVAAIQVGIQYRIPESERLRLEQEAIDAAAASRAGVA